MENKKRCQILEKLEQDIRLRKEDLKEIGFIDKEIRRMFKDGIDKQEIFSSPSSHFISAINSKKT